MTDGIIKKNLSAAAAFAEKAKAVTAGQIAEAVFLAGKTGLLSPEAAAEAFTDSFGMEPLCAEFAMYCKMLCGSNLASLLQSESYNGDGAGVISYLSNTYSENAFRLFAEKITGAVPGAQSDFRSVCEAVSSEKSEFCILPVCSSADGHFQPFRRLLKTYELKTVSCCRVVLPDSDNETRLALLARSAPVSDNTDFLDFSFIPSDNTVFFSICEALSALSAEIVSVLSSPLEYNIDKAEFNITVKKANGCVPLHFFLEAALPGVSHDGAYNLIN